MNKNCQKCGNPKAWPTVGTLCGSCASKKKQNLGKYMDSKWSEYKRREEVKI